MIYDLCIIGGGPAGLFAAINAAKRGLSCILLEKMEKTGRKLRISGKGRCNITNTRGKEDFISHMIHGQDFISTAIDHFSSEDTVRFFESLGVKTIEERGGRIFPESGKAWDVAQALIDEVRRLGVTVKFNCKVTSITRNEISTDNDNMNRYPLFSVESEDGKSIDSDNVLIATGGASYPSTGSTGDGYAFAWKLGHTIIPVRPSLTHLEIKGKPMPILLKNVNASIEINGKTVSSEFGEVEFNDRGIAGAAIISQSIHAVDAILEEKKVYVILDLKPALEKRQIIERLKRENVDGLTAKDLLRKLIPGQMINSICASCKISPKVNLPESQYEIAAKALKSLRLPVTGYGDFPYAIVTAGGVDVNEIDSRTMESKICPGLYFAGEVMDIDARTGGYNIQLALSTAALASDSIMKRN